MRNNTNIIHVVIDIETLGTVASMLKKGTCPIIQAAFTEVSHIGSEWIIANGNCTPFSLGNQHEFDADQDTVYWHTTNNNENYVSQLRDALECSLDQADVFRRWLEAINARAKNEGKEVRYWSRGKDFDFPILTSYAMQNNFTYPFMRDYGFSRTHCIRDLEKFFGIDGKQFKNSNPHDAMYDSEQEAKVLCHWLNGGDHE